MSELLEPGAVYQGLQDVQDGADPADVYARLMEGAVDQEEAVMEMFMDDVEAEHDFDECREKNTRGGFCHGNTCVYLGSMRMQVDCPCDCHKNDPEES